MSWIRHRTIAGLGLLGAGTVTILGITTAEAFFPGYSTADQTISALGAAGGTTGSRLVFNTAMIVAGVLTLLAAYGLHHVYRRHSLTIVVAIIGTGGFIGVGLFPAETGVPHLVAAVLVFTGAGVAALIVAAVVRGPFGYVSAILGVLELGTLALFVAGGEVGPFGIGTVERWVAYLAVTWAVAFGGVLLPADRRSE